MLRKVIHIILTLVMLVSTMGMTVSKHFCGNKLISVSVTSEAKFCCDDVGEDGCCRNETDRFELDVDTLLTVFNIDDVQESELNIFIPLLCLFDKDRTDGVNYAFIPFSPPPPKILSRLSTIQVFRL